MRRSDRSLFGKVVDHAGSKMDFYGTAGPTPEIGEPANEDGVRNHARGALLVSRKLLAGVSAIDVAGEEPDARTFAIGAMAANLIARDLVQEWARAPEALFATMEPIMSRTIPVHAAEGLSLRRPIWVGRDAYINRVAASGALRPGTAIRQVKPSQSTPSPREICQLVSQHSARLNNDGVHVSHDEIVSAGRSRHVTRARFVATWVMREVCGMSLSAIGQQLGGRDHTTILNALNRIPIERSNDVSFRRATDSLCIKADEIGLERHHRVLAAQYRPRPKLLSVA